MDIEKAKEHIKNAWIAGLISAGLTIIAIIISIVGNSDKLDQMGISVWTSIDVLIMLGLTYGVFRNNRFCALFLFIFFIGNKILMIISGMQTSGIMMSLAFGYFFYQGAVGAFALHRLTGMNESVDSD